MFILDKDSGESKLIEINKKKKMKNEDINSCVYVLIQWSTNYQQRGTYFDIEPADNKTCVHLSIIHKSM